MMTDLQTLAHCLALAKAHVSAVEGVLDLDLSDENDPVLAMQEVSLVCHSALMGAVAVLQAAQGIVQDLSKSGGKA